MAGYSPNPLWKKLGYKAERTVYVHGAPKSYRGELKLPDEEAVVWLKKPERGVMLIHAFSTSMAELRKLILEYRKLLAPDGSLWISWPKKAAKVETDVTEDRVREIARPIGLVDVKICAIDEVWSGLKLMIRKELR